MSLVHTTSADVLKALDRCTTEQARERDLRHRHEALRLRALPPTEPMPPDTTAAMRQGYPVQTIREWQRQGLLPTW